MPDYYAVITFTKGDENIDAFMTSFEKWLKDKPQVILVREHGSKGDNPHLNLVINASRIDNLRRDLTTVYKNSKLKYNRDRSLRIQRTDNLEKLVNHYLEKEDAREVLIRRGYNLPPPVKKVYKKKKNRSMGDKMIEAMPICRHGIVHSDGSCWNCDTILEWTYDYCVENRIGAIPSVYSKLSTLALQERLPTTGDGLTKQALKDLTINNYKKDHLIYN